MQIWSTTLILNSGTCWPSMFQKIIWTTLKKVFFLIILDQQNLNDSIKSVVNKKDPVRDEYNRYLNLDKKTKNLFDETSKVTVDMLASLNQIKSNRDAFFGNSITENLINLKEDVLEKVVRDEDIMEKVDELDNFSNNKSLPDKYEVNDKKSILKEPTEPSKVNHDEVGGTHILI